MMTSFSKYSGCGNDFIIFDNRRRFLKMPLTASSVAKLCHRQQGIGADGILILENSCCEDFKMHIFNADGSEAEMCGNGVRCLSLFIIQSGFSKNCFTLETKLQQMKIKIVGEKIKVTMPCPSPLIPYPSLQVDDKIFDTYYIDTGVPHAVIFVADIDDNLPLDYAPKIRSHFLFGEKGANVNFAQILDNGSIKIRTYERGVEQETLACGTGAAAVAIVAKMIHHVAHPVDIHPRSKETLTISLLNFPNGSEQLIMEGPAKKIFQGEVDLEQFGFRLQSSASFL